jgi:hypothetical protein
MRLTFDTCCDFNSSAISASSIPARSEHLMTPLLEFRDWCGVAAMSMLKKLVHFRIMSEMYQLFHSCFQANTLASAGDMIEAQRMSHRAKKLLITSIVIGVALTILAIMVRLTHDYDH